jgi:acetyl-CoA synthetase
VRRPTITKQPSQWKVVPNLVDYERARAEFTWEAARAELDGLPGGGLNIAYEAVDRHAAGARAEQVALRFWRKGGGSVVSLTYAELRSLTDRFASLLVSLGVGHGDTVFSLAGRIPELYVAALGTLKAGAVFCPLFSAFGPEPVRERMAIGRARVLLTTDVLYARKIAPIREQLPYLEHVLLVRGGGSAAAPLATLDLAELMAAAADHFAVVETDAEDRALLHFTSGTTGRPKGAVHVHGAVVHHLASARSALDLHDGDVYWCTADPGWVTGTSYGIVAPLVAGVTTIVDEDELDAERWWRLLAEERVNVWYTAPTAIRMLMRLDGVLPRALDLSCLRHAASVGEPLDPEAVAWGLETFGTPFHDTWWQTETGGIMIANFAATDVEPGSMGRPLPGIDAAIVRRRSDGGVDVVDEPDSEGEIAIRTSWPSMFRGYLVSRPGNPAHDSAGLDAAASVATPRNIPRYSSSSRLGSDTDPSSPRARDFRDGTLDDERYRACFADGWYLSGDVARRDEAGRYWFVGRGDDVIKSAGHLIGPFEVESALLAHPAVVDAGVIGTPDPVAREVVKAFVVVGPGFEADEKLRRELLGFARSRLGPVVAPRAIEFVASVPKNRSGKIVRRLLKARELGLPEGDLSTLEGEAGAAYDDRDDR